jgi:adenosylcobyric acid synthase
MPAVLESFEKVAEDADLVLCEGAGSPAEVNLREGDIANMGFASTAGVPVVLVGDIERGGVIAQIVGTTTLLEADERALLRGYIVNKFRGDPRLFDAALAIIEERSGLGALGVVPWLDSLRHLPKEDTLGLAGLRRAPGGGVRIVVPRLPSIANFDDLDPLSQEPGVDLAILQAGTAVPGNTDLVLLPGSKATLRDLAALREAGWDIDILAHHRRGGHVLGLCGGYQMLGRVIADPAGLEGAAGEARGLGLLDVRTTLVADKSVRLARGREVLSGLGVAGYEIHLGRTDGPDTARPLLEIDGRPEGARSADGRVAGCYLHGIFASDGFRSAFLERLRDGTASALAYDARIEATLDELALHLERHLAIDRLLAIARERSQPSPADTRTTRAASGQ